MRSIDNWMSKNFMDYKTATDLAEAAIDMFKMIEPDDEVYYKVLDLACKYIKEV